MAQVDVSTGIVQSASEPEVRVLRERLSGLGIDPRSRKPEVDQIETPRVCSAAEDKVARLDVAVDDAFLVDVLDDVQLWGAYLVRLSRRCSVKGNLQSDR